MKNLVLNSDRKPLIAPSLLSADFSQLAQEVSSVERAGADLLHIDVMDGRFVPNITIGPFVVEAIHRCASVPLDLHLMIVEPERYLESFRRAGASIITVHVEACVHLHRIVEAIHALGAAAGVSLNPATPLTAVEEVFPFIDLLLVMSVNPGFGGQRFIQSSIEKIKRADTWRRANGAEFLIEVDGGVTAENAAALCDAGTDVLVSGSTIFRSDDRARIIASMRTTREERGR